MSRMNLFKVALLSMSLSKTQLACMTGALWAKRGERDISRGARHEHEARDEEKRKIKSTEVRVLLNF